MTPEHTQTKLDNAIDLLQLITEDVESEFINAHVDGAVKARAAMIVSALAILDSYLREIREGVPA